MYEKQGTPPCGALNSYIWNRCISEIADAIEDIALLRVEELHLLDSRGDSAEQQHRGISKEQLACAELRSFRLERMPVIAVDADTVYFRSEIFCEFQLHAIGGVPDEEEEKFLWTSCKLTLLPAGHRMEVLQVNPMVNGEYTRKPLYPLPEFPGVSANQDLLPDLSGMYDAAHKESLEKEAKQFLTQYCREALEQPQVVPIRQIGEEKMGINLIVDHWPESQQAPPGYGRCRYCTLGTAALHSLALHAPALHSPSAAAYMHGVHTSGTLHAPA